MARSLRLCRRLSVLGVLLLLSLLSASSLFAQTDASGSPDSMLRPGDRILITLLDGGDMIVNGQNGQVIPPDGHISFYNAEVMAAGRTRDQVQADLIQHIKKLILSPQVTVSLLESPYNVIRLSGAVAKPGEYNFREGLTLFQALTTAGGSTSLANKSAFVYRKEPGKAAQSLTFDLQALMSGDLSQDIALQPGDIIQVSDAAVFVDGRVKAPGTFPLRSADTVSKAITAAGGQIAEADLQNAFIRRKGENIPVDLRDIMKGRTDSPALSTPLQPGDELVIPPIESKVTVFGDVGTPGFVFLLPKERDKVRDALAQAGGAHPTADLSKVRLQRILNGAPVGMDLDIGPQGEPGNDVILQDGDFIYVPTKKEKNRTEALFTASIAAQLLSVLRNL